MNEKDFIIGFLKALPNGQTRYPMELVIDKMGSNVEISVKTKLKSLPLDFSQKKEDTKLVEIRV